MKNVGKLDNVLFIRVILPLSTSTTSSNAQAFSEISPGPYPKPLKTLRLHQTLVHICSTFK